MMDKKKGVYVEMNQRELDAYRQMKTRDSRSDREILLGSGAGLPVEKRSRGRVSAADAELKIQRDRYADYRYQIHEDGLRYLNGDEGFTAKRVTCPNCGVSFVTRRPAPGQCTCWRCGQTIKISSAPRNYELEPSTLNKPTTPENEPVNTGGNLDAGWAAARPPRPAVTGWDMDRFKFGSRKPRDKKFREEVSKAEKDLQEQNRKLQLQRDAEYKRRLAEG